MHALCHGRIAGAAHNRSDGYKGVNRPLNVTVPRYASIWRHRWRRIPERPVSGCDVAPLWPGRQIGYTAPGGGVPRTLCAAVGQQLHYRAVWWRLLGRTPEDSRHNAFAAGQGDLTGDSSYLWSLCASGGFPEVAVCAWRRGLRGIRGLRDRALLLVGFAGALRRSELVALNATMCNSTRKAWYYTCGL